MFNDAIRASAVAFGMALLATPAVAEGGGFLVRITNTGPNAVSSGFVSVDNGSVSNHVNVGRIEVGETKEYFVYCSYISRYTIQTAVSMWSEADNAEINPMKRAPVVEADCTKSTKIRLPDVTF